MKDTALALTALVLGVVITATPHAGKQASRLDGRWQAWYTSSRSKAHEMEFSEGRFHAAADGQWYEGEIALDVEADPARIDFTIRDCDCNLVNKTSTGIFRWDGEAIEIRAPAPGDPRPAKFDGNSAETIRLVRADD